MKELPGFAGFGDIFICAKLKMFMAFSPEPATTSPQAMALAQVRPKPVIALQPQEKRRAWLTLLVVFSVAPAAD